MCVQQYHCIPFTKRKDLIFSLNLKILFGKMILNVLVHSNNFLLKERQILASFYILARVFPQSSQAWLVLWISHFLFSLFFPVKTRGELTLLSFAFKASLCLMVPSENKYARSFAFSSLSCTV